MFRPTHFVILFAVVLYVTALPAEPAKPAPQGPGVPGVGSAPKDHAQPAKSDLKTDAQTHLGYTYSYGPTWGYFPGRGWGPYIRRSGWGLELLY